MHREREFREVILGEKFRSARNAEWLIALTERARPPTCLLCLPFIYARLSNSSFSPFECIMGNIDTDTLRKKRALPAFQHASRGVVQEPHEILVVLL